MLCLPSLIAQLFAQARVNSIDATGRDLQHVIDAAPSNAVVHCDASRGTVI